MRKAGLDGTQIAAGHRLSFSVSASALAKRNAEQVIRRSVGPDWLLIAPMRSTEAQLTLAVIAARQGDAAQADALGVHALQNGRQSRPSLLMVAGELEHELDTYRARTGGDFRDLLAGIRNHS
jgi:hypothetical protein